jgi:hypothetical protein
MATFVLSLCRSGFVAATMSRMSTAKNENRLLPYAKNGKENTTQQRPSRAKIRKQETWDALSARVVFSAACIVRARAAQDAIARVSQLRSGASPIVGRLRKSALNQPLRPDFGQQKKPLAVRTTSRKIG